MTAGFGAVMFAVGIAAWIYSQFMKRTNNQRSSLIAAVVTAIIAFVIFFTAFRTFFS